MCAKTNRQVLLRKRPQGTPTADDFEIVEQPMPTPGEGEVLCRTIYLSVDPYMRGLMSGKRSYREGAKLGEVMVGESVSQVVESRSDGFAKGDVVRGFGGWQQYWVAPGEQVTKLSDLVRPISYGLGVLGMPGLTAYVGLLDIGRPKQGETVVVSSASGAVGSVVVQIARIRGCRVVGSAGSDEKVAWVTDELRADACINYKTQDLFKAVRRACPDGIDVYFDCVGGEMLKAVLPQMNVGGRIPLIGMISQYNDETPPPGPNLIYVLMKRLLIQGMIVGDHQDRRDAFGRDVSGWLKSGEMTYRQTVAEGIDSAPAAFIGLFSGANVGKQLVQVSDDPMRGG